MSKKITERDTKATILKALREAEKKIAELEKGKLDAAKEAKKKKEAEITNKADQLMEGNIEGKITDLSKSVVQLLTKIDSDLKEQTKNLQTVKEAIAIKEAELKELFDIEKQAHTLAGLVNAHQELKLSQEKELAEEKEKATNELEEIKKQIEIARKEYQTMLKEQKEALELQKKEAKKSSNTNSPARKNSLMTSWKMNWQASGKNLKRKSKKPRKNWMPLKCNWMNAKKSS